MPYSSLTRPSLALGLLETYISEYGYKVESLYANLEFAEVIGINQYDVIDSSNHEHLFGEWTFSRSAFPDKKNEDEAYFALFSDISSEHKKQLLRVREKAESFIGKLACKILENNPKIIGCTSTFQQNCASLALLRIIKSKRPDIITMMGGANCEGTMGQTISDSFSWVDYVFSGESDEVIGNIIDQLIQGVKYSPYNLPDGLIAQNSNILLTNQVAEKTPPRAIVENMQKVGVPVYDSYFNGLKSYGLSDSVYPGLVVETSRGCWWGAKQHCTFCGLNGKSMTHRSKAADDVLSEFKGLSNQHKTNKFEIVDNILPMEYMKTLLPRLAEGANYSLFYETKSNLKKQHIEKLASAGVKWIQPGFESLHDDFLRLVKKGTTAVMNIAALKWCRTYGVNAFWNMLCNAPGEDPQWYIEMAQWLPLVFHLQPPCEELIRIRYPRFSPYFKNPNQYGLVFEPIKTYDFVYPLLNQDLFDIAYFFDNVENKTKGIYSLGTEFNHQSDKHQRLQTKMSEWCESWRSDKVPVLFMIDKGNNIIVMDSRSVATQSVHLLQGMAALIYRLCEEPISRGRLLIKILESGENLSERELDAQLQLLIDSKLCLDVSKCILSLALKGDIPAMQEAKKHPAGYLKLRPERNEPDDVNNHELVV